MVRCYLETGLTTSQISYPFQSGWLDAPDWLVLQDRVSTESIADERAVALVDAVDAARLLDTHSVISDVALVSTHRGPIAMRSSTRPDEIQHATVQLGSVSSTAEAVARATVYHFYGIDVVDWVRSGQESDVTIRESVDALVGASDGYSEDLVRAWFILTSLALPTHLLIAPTQLVTEDQSGVEHVAGTLRSAVRASDDRRRELRRNVSDDLGIERELVTEFFNDQTTRLTRNGRKGWLDLVNRVARPLSLQPGPSPDVVSFGLSRDDQE